MLDFPPILFIAMARVSCASPDIEPYDIAPVANLLTISDTGSTSSSGIEFFCEALNFSKPRKVASSSD